MVLQKDGENTMDGACEQPGYLYLERELKFLGHMRKEGLENLTLARQIDGKRSKVKTASNLPI